MEGRNPDAFQEYWENYDSFEVVEADSGVTVTADPAEVEGINLSDKETQNMPGFWQMHETGGTQDSFVEIARLVPEVQSRLDAGESLSDLLRDPRLGQCASVYFQNAPIVDKVGGIYVFNSNGRHRILAARAAGVRIPLRIARVLRRKP